MKNYAGWVNYTKKSDNSTVSNEKARVEVGCIRRVEETDEGVKLTLVFGPAMATVVVEEQLNTIANRIDVARESFPQGALLKAQADEEAAE